MGSHSVCWDHACHACPSLTCGTYVAVSAWSERGPGLELTGSCYTDGCLIILPPSATTLHWHIVSIPLLPFVYSEVQPIHNLKLQGKPAISPFSSILVTTSLLIVVQGQ